MRGDFYFESSRLDAHDHVTVGTMSSGAIIVFNDPRRFGQMDIIEAGGLDHRSRPEVTWSGAARSRGSTRRLSRTILKGKKTTLKAALSDQRVVAGLGEHLCVRGAPSCGPVTKAALRVDACHRNGRASTRSQGAGRCDSSRADGGDREQESISRQRSLSRLRS